MKREVRRVSVVVASLAAVLVTCLSAQASGRTAAPLPMSFEPNAGQLPADVKFFTRGPGYQLFLTADQAVFAFLRPGGKSGVVRMKIEGASTGTRVVGEGPLPGRVHYLVGRDPKSWRTDVPTYRRVRFENVYPGIDLVYYGNESGRLEYDFLLRPGADAAVPRVSFRGLDAIGKSAAGDLVGRAPAGSFSLLRPVAWQEEGGVRRMTAVAYRATGESAFGFEVGPFDRTQPLIIDPTLDFSTYLGGSGTDAVRDVAVDGAGNAYAAGDTPGLGFPTAGGLGIGSDGVHLKVFVSKFAPNGSLLYSTFFGGSKDDFDPRLAVDSLSNVYLCGETFSSDIPLVNAYQTIRPGGTSHVPFVAKIGAAGDSVVYSTFLSGSNPTSDVRAIAVDSGGSATVAGSTNDATFPRLNSFQQGCAGGLFVTRFSPAGNSLLFSSCLTGGGPVPEAVAVESSGATWVVGSVFDPGSSAFPLQNPTQGTYGGGALDAFVLKLAAAGNSLLFSTYLGGPAVDAATSVSLDIAENAYVGGTGGAGFPAGVLYPSLPGNAFVTKYTSGGSGVWSVIAPVFSDFFVRVAVDGPGRAHVVGTAPNGFPLINPVLDTDFGNTPLGVLRLSPTGGAVEFSTRLAGSTLPSGSLSASGIAVDGGGGIVVGGSTTQQGFPVKNAVVGSLAGSSDGFVTRMDPGAGPLVTGTSPGSGPSLGGTSITVTGSGFVSGARVTLGGSPASTGSVTSNAITAVTGPHAAGPVAVRVDNLDGSAAELANGFTYVCGATAPTAAVSGSTTICSGGTATLSVALTGSGAWTLLWSDGFVQSGVTSTPAFRTVGPSATTVYTVTTVTDANCAGAGSGGATVTVVPRPSASITAPPAACTDATGLVASVPDGGPGVSYTWTITNGTITSGAGTHAVTFSVGAASPLQLSVTVSNGICPSSSSVSLPVTPAATAVVSGGGTVCAGEQAPITVALTGAPPWTLLWSDGLLETGVGTSPWTRNVAPVLSTSYTLSQVTDATSCSGSVSGSAAFVVKPVPVSQIFAAPTVCAASSGNAASVPDAGAGAAYTWSIGNGSITGGNGTRQITYTAGAAGSVSLGVTVLGGNGCSSTSSQVVPTNPLPTAALSGPSTGCAGQPTVLTVALTGRGPWTVTWTDGTVQSGVYPGPATRAVSPLTDTTYALSSVSDVTGCSGSVSGTVALTVKPVPTAVVHGGATICPDTPVPISADVTAVGAWTLRWGDGVTQTGAGSGTATRIVAPNASTVYGVESIADTQCTNGGTGVAAIIVGLGPEAVVVTVPSSVCAGTPGIVASVPDSGEGSTYAWTLDNGTITSGQGTRQITFTAATPGTATLGITVGAAGGCSRSRPWTIGVAPSPTAPPITGPASARTGDAGLVAEVPYTPASTYAWMVENGTIRSGQGTSRIVFDAGLPGAMKITVTERTGSACPSPPSTLVVPVSGVETVRTVPVVTSTPGAGGAYFTTELTLSNPGATEASVDFAYTPSEATGGGGTVVAHDTVPAGGQKVIPDVLAWLGGAAASRGLLDSLTGAGSLKVSFENLPLNTLSFAGARTTSASGAGRAGLAYPASDAAESAAPAVWLFGLRENAADRSNLALVNAGGAAPVTLRLTLYAGGAGDGRKAVLEPVTLAPGQWTQINSVLNKAGFTNGYALVERIAGTDPYIAYAVVNDNATNDGSYVAAVPAGRTGNPQALPVLVETPSFSSELVLTNPGSAPVSASLTYVESLAHPNGSSAGNIVESLAPFEQRIVPNAVEYLRSRGGVIGPKGGSYAGTLLVRFTAATLLVDGFAGARTSAPAPEGGQFGLFCAGVPLPETAAAGSWVFGLQQNGATRSNLALYNASGNQGPVTLQFDVFDGDTGRKAATSPPVALSPGQWKQFNSVLKTWGLSNGYVRVTRISGKAGWGAYGVVNDGGSPGSGTGDGSFVAMTPGP
jgi:hypothetical protein